MSRLAAVLRAAFRVSTSPAAYPSNTAAAAASLFRRFSTDASGAAGEPAAADSPNDSFFPSYGESLVFGRFFSVVSGSRHLGKNMLKTDIIHYLDQCGLLLDDVKFDYNKGFTPICALLRFPSAEKFNKAFRQTSQDRLYRLERLLNLTDWDLKQSYDGKAVLLQGVPRVALPDDIERFLAGTNFEASTFENYLIPGVPEPVRMVLVKYPTKTAAMNAFIAKNRGFCLNSPISMRVLQ